jgi:hypothetical protein
MSISVYDHPADGDKVLKEIVCRKCIKTWMDVFQGTCQECGIMFYKINVKNAAPIDRCLLVNKRFIRNID